MDKNRFLDDFSSQLSRRLSSRGQLYLCRISRDAAQSTPAEDLFSDIYGHIDVFVILSDIFNKLELTELLLGFPSH